MLYFRVNWLGYNGLCCAVDTYILNGLFYAILFSSEAINYYLIHLIGFHFMKCCLGIYDLGQYTVKCCENIVQYDMIFHTVLRQPRNYTNHYNDVIMGMVASQITSLTIVYSIVYSDTDQRKHQSSASLAFVRGPVNSPHKWPVTRKMFPFDNVIMFWV